jgi:hypothetical protein
LDFSFISDEQFRNSLTNDYQEMISCHEASSWKAVHVLAGSIVEALLVEYLVVSSTKPGGKDPLTIALSDAIQACQKAGVIQKSTASLCDVVRDYRNLIHPGRMIRLDQNVTQEGASIALNLVAIITREVAEKRKATYGPTAEQIVKKLRTDQHALALLPQLLSETNHHERKKLLFSTIPEAYLLEEKDSFISDESVLSRLRIAYRQTLDLMAIDEKTKIAAKFVKSIREDSAEKIQSYGDAFFLAEDIMHLQPPDKTITIGYFISRLEQSGSNLTDGLFRTTIDLGGAIPIAEAERIATVFIRLVLRQPDKSLQRALALAENVFDSAGNDVKAKIESRLDQWRAFAKKNGHPEATQDRLAELSRKWINIPF